MSFINMPDEEKRIVRGIVKARNNLEKTDYISDKLIIAVVHYVLTGDKSKVIEMYNEYMTQIDNRQLDRDKINALQEELKRMAQQTAGD